MKKILIVVGIAMMAMCSQAAKFRWGTSGDAVTNPDGKGTYSGSATLYCLFQGEETRVADYDMSNGIIGTHVVTWTPEGMVTGQQYNFYYKMTDDASGAVYTSVTMPATAQASATAPLIFQGGAWAVPEPTSGLLLLLGVAGLALRRRRA